MSLDFAGGGALFGPIQASAANFPLEITNIKPAGTGNPAISSTNRIFRAYPGIEYNIRAVIIGGLYPFTYALSNAPEGMTIDASTGETLYSRTDLEGILSRGDFLAFEVV